MFSCHILEFSIRVPSHHLETRAHLLHVPLMGPHVIYVKLRLQQTIKTVLTLEAVLLARCQFLLYVDVASLFQKSVFFPDSQTLFFLLDAGSDAYRVHILSLDQPSHHVKITDFSEGFRHVFMGLVLGCDITNFDVVRVLGNNRVDKVVVWVLQRFKEPVSHL